MTVLDKFPPIDDVISRGILPRVMHLVLYGDPRVKFELAWMLTNIACGAPAHIQALLENNGIPTLLASLDAKEDVRYDGLRIFKLIYPTVISVFGLLQISLDIRRLQESHFYHVIFSTIALIS